MRGTFALTHSHPYQSLLRYRRSHQDRLERPQDHPRSTAYLCAVLCRRLAFCTLHQMERGNRFGSVVRTFISQRSQLIWGLGDKTNHIPAFHVPQVYYFVAFSTVMGWPALISGKDGLRPLIHGIVARMWGTKRSAVPPPFWSRHSSHIQAECRDTGFNPSDGVHCRSLYVSVYYHIDDRLLNLIASITHSCCPITAITRSTFGGGFSCCTLSYRTS